MVARPAVLVTRPELQAPALCAALENIGYRAYSQPLLELAGEREPSPRQRQSLLDLDHYQHIIFISGNAIRFGMPWIEDYWPQLPEGINWYAIGNASARALEAYGLSVITHGDSMTSESLLASPQLQSVEGQRVLIVKGHGGRATLGEELARRDARVDELCCYQRRCPRLAPGELSGKLANWAIGLILISSGEGLANLLTLLSRVETSKLRTVTLIVPSGRVARMAKEAGFVAVRTAENASDSAMLRAVEDAKR